MNFWVQKDVVAVIKKYQKYLLLNIANEAGTDTVSQNNFAVTYRRLVKKNLSAGIQVPLIIDAANWGRNESYLLTNGQAIVAADPGHNVIFAWHIWDSGISESRISKAIDESIVLDINLLIAEFDLMEVKCK